MVFEQLLQKLHVELVIMTHLVFCESEAWGHTDGVATAGWGDVGSLVANETDGGSLPQRHPFIYNSDGRGKWYQTPGVG